MSDREKRQSLLDELEEILAEFQMTVAAATGHAWGLFDQRVMAWSNKVANEFGDDTRRAIEMEIGEWLGFHRLPPGGFSKFQQRAGRARSILRDKLQPVAGHPGTVASLAEGCRFGIVTALPKEFAAMRAMLDEARDHIVDGDPNDYVIGSIPASDGSGEHQVVVTLLKKAGNNTATGAAVNLLRSFPDVQDVLMVGIAGGAPDHTDPDKHVRLGDIVVSNECGVLQYDNIKLAEGIVEVRSTSSPPSAALVGHTRFLEADRLAGKRPWEEHIKRASHLEGVARPKSSTDRLYSTDDPRVQIRHPRDPNRRAGEPRVHYGRIGSANILLRDAKRRDALRDQYGARAVEMEGSGIADGTWEFGQSYMLIRGAADYCDFNKNKKWQGYASVVAAAYARALIESFPAGTGPAKVRARSGAQGKLKRGGEDGLANVKAKRAAPLAIPPLPPRLTDENEPFEIRVEVEGQLRDVSEIANLALRFRRLAVLGRAGAGKTIAGLRALRSCSDRIPGVFVGRDGWIRELGDALLKVDPDRPFYDWRTALDILLRGATSDVTVDQIEALATEGAILLVVDGINAGSAPVATRVLDALDEALRHLQSAAALVTDRTATRYPVGGRWTIANVIKLDSEVTARRIDSRYGTGTWDRMPDGPRRLLSSPFFLDLALRGAKLTSATRSAALGNFIADQARIEPAAVAETAAATAAAYATGSRRLQRDALSPTTAGALVETGITALAGPGATHLAFTHELFGDYFASLHLARGLDSWQPSGLDAVSFSRDRWRFEGLSADTESFDTITLAAEQIDSTTVGDPYLRAVYDWNWRAAVDCLAATDPLEGPFSPATRLVVLSLLSERRSDPVDGTRQRATRLLKGLPDDLAHRLAAAPESDARTIIGSHDFPVPWFDRWRAVFCRNPQEPWSDQALDDICDPDLLHGWTVSYVLKRNTLSSDACQRLQGTYRGLRVGATARANLQASIRWRIVHSLAAGDGDAILTFLLSALDDDPYPWVRWGAARSITEFAARSQRLDLTARAIDELTTRAPEMPESLCQEIAWASQYHGAALHFSSLMRPLLKTLQASASGEIARARWDEWMTRFDRFWAPRS